MKLAVVALACLVSVVDARVADACGPPEPTCGENFCSTAVVGLIEATVASLPTTENFVTSVAVHVTSGWGMTDGIPAGSDVTLVTAQIFRQEDVGRSFVLYLVRSGGDLTIQRGIDLTERWATKCFGDDVTAETLATIVLAEDCDLTLSPGGPSSGDGCPDENTCNAGGAVGGSPIALALGGLVLRRRRRLRRERCLMRNAGC